MLYHPDTYIVRKKAYNVCVKFFLSSVTCLLRKSIEKKSVQIDGAMQFVVYNHLSLSSLNSLKFSESLMSTLLLVVKKLAIDTVIHSNDSFAFSDALPKHNLLMHGHSR